MEDGGGIPWILIHLGWIVLAAVLIYGIYRSRRINKREKRAQQRATRENFRADDDSTLT
jgi:FtsZ-interacting cell division protein ZipA